MNHQGDVLRVLIQPNGVKPGVQIAGVVNKAVGAGGVLARIAHADQVGRQATRATFDLGNNVAPQIRRGGVAVQKHDRVAAAGIDIGHFTIEHGYPFSFIRIVG